MAPHHAPSWRSQRGHSSCDACSWGNYPRTRKIAVIPFRHLFKAGAHDAWKSAFVVLPLLSASETLL